MRAAQGLAQVAVVLGAIAAWPALPCDTDWVRASERGCLRCGCVRCGRVCVCGCVWCGCGRAGGRAHRSGLPLAGEVAGPGEEAGRQSAAGAGAYLSYPFPLT